jgi:MYXO-CTERM domain-containing protein
MIIRNKVFIEATVQGRIMKKRIGALALALAVIASASVSAASLSFEGSTSSSSATSAELSKKSPAKSEVQLTGYGQNAAHDGGGVRRGAPGHETPSRSTPDPESLALALLGIAVLGGRRLRGSSRK